MSFNFCLVTNQYQKGFPVVADQTGQVTHLFISCVTCIIEPDQKIAEISLEFLSSDIWDYLRFFTNLHRGYERP